ncbi:MAG: hypothetical protein F4X54_07490 [Chloroflexi bacterium]|nr:hypothetical protein [Chloroflexota bacterium]MYB84561.1 hypothetical protein [Chloroflexota bacterium]
MPLVGEKAGAVCEARVLPVNWSRMKPSADRGPLSRRRVLQGRLYSATRYAVDSARPVTVVDPATRWADGMAWQFVNAVICVPAGVCQTIDW